VPVLLEREAAVGELGSVSRSSALALTVLSFGIGLGLRTGTAEAQSAGCGTPYSCNQELLGNFGVLADSPAGMAILEQNLAIDIGIYLGASAERRQTAALDSQLIESTFYYNIWNHAAPELSGLFDLGNQLNPGTNFPDDEYIEQTGAAINAFGSLAGQLKDYFAQTPGLNSYNAAYTILPQYAAQQPLDPRPFVVSSQINGNAWTTATASQIAVDIQQSETPPAGYQPQAWPEYVTSPAFPSGHSTLGNSLAILTAIMAPGYYQDFLMAGVEFGLSRNIFGVHYPLDVIGGRIIATYNIAEWLNGRSYSAVGLGSPDIAGASAALQAYIGSGGSSPYAAACAGDVVGCIRAGAIPSAEEFAEARELYTYLLTYGLPSLSDTTAPPVVPEGAEVLLKTRFPYLAPSQIREILATTELPSGGVFDNGVGWDRLNLFAAADGFGALNCGGEGAEGCIQSVTMKAALGGFNAFDVWANDITGDGGLQLSGDGVLVLAGRSTYSGGTGVLGGTLAVTGSILGPVTIASGASLYNAGTIGSGTGDFVINAGDLLNDGAIDADVLNAGSFENDGWVSGFVATSGSLSGMGSIGGDLLVAGGVVAPGNSIGTITVGGDLGLAAAAVLEIEIDPNGTSDQIRVGGDAAIDGASMQVSLPEGAVMGLRSYSVITAGGSVTGEFASLNDPFGAAYPFLDAALTYNGDTVRLDTQRSSVPFTVFARSANQSAVAAALETFPLRQDPFSDAVLSLNASNAAAAYTMLSGEIGASAKSVFIDDSRFLRDAVTERMRGTAASPQPGLSAVAAPARDDPNSGAVWARGFGAWSSIDGDGNAADLDSNTGGLFIGADTGFEGWKIGIVGGYSSTDFETRAASGNSEDWHLGLYGGHEWGDFALRTGLAYSWQSVETTRGVAFPGYSDVLNAGYGSGMAQAFGEVGYGIDLAPARLEPFAGLAYVSLQTDGHAEEGGGAALVVPDSTMETAFSTLGLRATLPLELGSARARLNGALGWQHAFGDVTPVSTQYFAAGGSAFTVSGLPLAVDSLLVEAGLHMTLSDSVALDAAYAGQFGDGTSQNGVNATLRVAF